MAGITVIKSAKRLLFGAKHPRKAMVAGIKIFFLQQAELKLYFLLRFVPETQKP
jgi:hypothetical protein